ncbi:unnamed protein product [Sympodiomycopsis kandeliae]
MDSLGTTSNTGHDAEAATASIAVHESAVTYARNVTKAGTQASRNSDYSISQNSRIYSTDSSMSSHDDNSTSETTFFLEKNGENEPCPTPGRLTARVAIWRRFRVVFAMLLVISLASSAFLFVRYATPKVARVVSSPDGAMTKSPNNIVVDSKHEEAIAPVPDPFPSFEHQPARDPIPFIVPPSNDRCRVESIDTYSPLTLSPHALEAWIAKGELLKDVNWPAEHTAREHDLIIASVNGSDPQHARLLKHYMAAKGKGSIREWWDSPTANHGVQRPVNSTAKGGSKERGKQDTSINRFREIDELKYAVRSAKQNMKDLATIHLLTPSFSPPRPYDTPQYLANQSKSTSSTRDTMSDVHSTFVAEDGRTQWGQVPHWLNVSHPGVNVEGLSSPVQSKRPSLRLHHDWQMWTPNWLFNASAALSSNVGWSLARLAEWKQEVLPSFNSLAVESNLGHESMEGLSENFIYSNDDTFTSSASSMSDFITPLYGPVLRLDNGLQVQGSKVSRLSDQGEWPSLRRSAWLLDERFGSRTRAYTVHEPKIFNTKLLREMRMMWAQQWRTTADQRFRNQDVEHPAINTGFLMAHFIIERHREALLWSFIVAKMDSNGDGKIGPDEMQRHLLDPLGIVRGETLTSIGELSPSMDLIAGVRFPYRSGLANGHHLDNLYRHNFAYTGKSSYDFISADGYPFMTLHPFVQTKSPLRPAGGGHASGISQVAQEPWPRYHPREGKTKDSDSRYRMKTPACQLRLGECLAGVKVNSIDGSVQSDELFKRFAFQRGDTCGDCLLVHLLGQSGAKGLEAFLPSEHQRLPSLSDTVAQQQRQEPHLPLSPNWNTSSTFTLSNLSSTLGWSSASLRHFTSLLIQRYTYTLASSPMIFAMMQNSNSVNRTLNNIHVNENLFICLNDDYSDNQASKIKQLFQNWAERVWSHKAEWEV